MKKQNIVIIAVIALVLVLAVGYALFSETLTISGTATATASLDVQFTAVGDDEAQGGSTLTAAVGYTHVATNPTHKIATISQDGKAVVIRVNKLDYPGAYVEIPVTVTNVGSLTATLGAATLTGTFTSAESPIIVSYTYDGVAYSSLTTSQKELAPNASKTIIVHVEWDPNNNTTTAEPANLDAQFTITLPYNQSANQ